MINTIIFDFFGVISSEVAHVWFDEHFSAKEAKILKDKYFKPFDAGKTTKAELFESLSLISNEAPNTISAKFDKLAKIDQNMVALIKKIKPRYKLGLLSNGGAEFVRPILKLHKLEALFDTIVISSDCGITKPNKIIYELTLGNLSVKAENTLFIDDNKNNIKGAQKLGMQTVLFKNYKQLNKDLDNLLQ